MRTFCPKRSRRAFTLAETLLVVSLLSMVSLAVFQAVTNGMKIWEFSTYYSREEDAALFLDKFAKELRNSFSYSRFTFEGTIDSISFPTMVTALKDRALSGGETDYVKQPGMVHYSYDLTSGSVVRRQSNYSEAVNERLGRQSTALRPVTGLAFSYILFEGEDLVKKDYLMENEVPFAVEIKISFPQQSGRIMTLRKLINIPGNLYRNGFIFDRHVQAVDKKKS